MTTSTWVEDAMFAVPDCSFDTAEVPLESVDPTRSTPLMALFAMAADCPILPDSETLLRLISPRTKTALRVSVTASMVPVEFCCDATTLSARTLDDVNAGTGSATNAPSPATDKPSMDD